MWLPTMKNFCLGEEITRETMAEKNETCYCDVEKTDVYKWRCSITVIVSREANKVADTGPHYGGVCKSGRRVQIGGGKVEPLDVSVQQDALREEELAALTSAGVCSAVETAFK